MIKIPEKGEEVVIHAPELEAGSVDSKGRSVLKPIKRKDTKFKASTAALIGGGVLLVVAVAFLLGRSDLGESLIYALAGGAAVLGPLVALAGYSFLRDDELGSYQGTALAIRGVACGLVYALLWGVYLYLGTQVFGTEAYQAGLEMVQIAGLCIFVMAVGAFTAFVSFDFDFLTGFMHYAFYFLATIGLRFVMGLTLIPGMGGE
jgi:hypothetical protein